MLRTRWPPHGSETWRFTVSNLIRCKARPTGRLSVRLGSSSAGEATVSGRNINLTDRGLQRHRILWVREMDESELRRVGEGGPTIDKIEVAVSM